MLEYSQSFGRQLLAFFNSDDVTHFGIEIQGRTLNTLEFFYDLKNGYHRAKKIKEIKINLFTAMLFYGTRNEKALAGVRLKELTGKDFTSPKEWLQYYRQIWN